LSNSKSPAQHYSRDLAEGKILPDSAQQEAIRELDLIYQKLVVNWQRPRGLLSKLLGKQAPVDVRGIYLWGGVGRGKTYLMDLFFHCLPGERKLFFVSDIGDAMILGNLLEALFDNGLVLVSTSNIIPARLYERGLQRQKFLPAIALLEANTQVLNVDGGTDYRLRTLESAGIYQTPLGESADKVMQDCFNRLTCGMRTEENKVLEILGREITTRQWSEGIAWFEFADLCDGPRSAADYIEISQLFHTVLVSNTPVFDEFANDRARRFITLVDEFYDQNVKLILSAAAPLESLYQGSELSFPFTRTQSRLLEMQSHEYLGLEHHPNT